MEQNQRKYKYHFTSCTSLYGMLKDYSMNNPYLTMWATHSSFMNDSSEYEYGRNKCMEVLRLYEKKPIYLLKNLFLSAVENNWRSL